MPGNILKGLIEDTKNVFKKPDAPKERFKLKDLAFFFQFVKPVWKLGALSLILAILISGVRAVIPMSGKVLIDFVIMKTGFDWISGILSPLGLGAYTSTLIDLFSSINFIVAVLFVVGIVYALLQIIQGYLTTKYQQELTYNLQTSLFDHVLRFPLSFFKNKQTGYVMSRISDDVDTLQYLFSSAITQFVSGVFFLIFGLGILLTLDITLVIIMACMLPVYLLLRLVFFERIRSLSYKERERHAELSQDMQEVLSGVEIVKTHATEERELEKVSGRLRNVIQVRLVNTILSSVSSSIMSGVQFVMLLLVMWVGVHEIQSGAMTVGDFVTFVAYVLFLTGAVNSLFYTYLSFQPLFASLDRLKEMFSVVPEFEKRGESKGLLMPDKVVGDVKFDNVSFAYNVDEPILKNISFQVRPGETVALVGPSGVGKTTLINLLLKLYIPQSGAIYLDGNDLNSLDHAWLRKQVGVVSQDIFLFNDTIENNIKYGKIDAGHEEVVEAAKKAQIHDFIMHLPNGYDTVIGERGAKMSLGQRQRISIARAFLKDSPLIILDEPTSAIDTETEGSIKESLRNLVKGRTTFIISHRMSLTDIADKIVVIEDGDIARIGSYQELIKEKELYNKLSSTEVTH
jgi:subfamily B ATP-binding cassette protein MsbA